MQDTQDSEIINAINTAVDNLTAIEAQSLTDNAFRTDREAHRREFIDHIYKDHRGIVYKGVLEELALGIRRDWAVTPDDIAQDFFEALLENPQIVDSLMGLDEKQHTARLPRRLCRLARRHTYFVARHEWRRFGLVEHSPKWVGAYCETFPEEELAQMQETRNRKRKMGAGPDA
jgi:hypothetical protein